MAEVYINSLTLKDFGPFYGEHTLDFRPLESSCGVLIGGKNGAGKTHLLRALYLAVVGESGIHDLKRVETGSDATKFLFERCLNRRALAEGQDTVTLKANISLRDEGMQAKRDIELTRQIRFRPLSPPVWSHSAKRSDNPTAVDDEQVIQKLRDAFLPRHLARFFFFDAERSQSINLGQQDIIEGISRILGLWTYTELETDLRSLIQSKIPRVFNLAGGQNPETKLADLSADVLRLEGHLKVHRREQVAFESDLRESEAELSQIEDDLKTLGAVDPEEMQKAQERRTEITAKKAQIDTKLSEAWELAVPVAVLGGYRKELHDYLISEERRSEWEGARLTVEPKLPAVKEAVFGNAPQPFALADDVEAFYARRLDKALEGLFHPPPEGMAERVFVVDRKDVSAQIRSRLANVPQSLFEIADLCERVERMDSELRELDQKLKQMQSNSAAFKRGAELHQKRGELTAKIAQLQQRLSEVAAEIMKMEAELGELKRQETNQREIVDKAERGESLVALATRYREAAGEVRVRAADQMRRAISDMVGELWVAITERSREFLGMHFDNQWQCHLIRRDGSKVPWEEINTSAGQRQVRMLAFYDALRRLAKLIPPLVVDTPLGRLDKEVQASVLDQMYLTGHQSVILTTNSEIDPEGPLFDSIRDRVARVYTLHPHGRPGSTDYEVRIASDYFGQTL